MALDRLFGLLLISSVLVDCYKEKACGIGEYNEGPTVPKGGLDVDYIEAIAKHKDEGSPVPLKYCYSQCCKLGPQRCQYMWVIWGSCFAVKCDTGSADKCQPVAMKSSDLYSTSSKVISSLYVEITRTSRTSETGEGRTVKAFTTTAWEDGGTDPSETMETETGPLARAGEDVLVVLPQTSVWLYGNHSAADKGIIYYLWQLTANDHPSKARVLDSTSPVARVVDLSPGAYTFSLTVLDSSYQSNSDSVIITVLAGSHDPTVGVTYTENSQGIAEANTTGNSTLGSEEVGGNVAAYSKKRMVLKVLLPVLVILLLVLVFSAVVVLLYAYLCGNSSKKGRKRQLRSYQQLTAVIEDT